MNSDGFIKIVELGSADVIKEAVNTSGETTSSEEKMLIEMDGVSVTAKPRKDGRYQGYVLQNGKKNTSTARAPKR